MRRQFGLAPSYRLVDTCAAEFEAYTPYYYSTYDRGDDEIKSSDKRKIMILGGGPNRIGQGIEFDYCCVHAAFALKEEGFETLMVNSNPGNRFDRLRHERQAVLRAADFGGRAAHLRTGEVLGRDRPVRRADAA